MTTSDGRTGVGEATLTGQEAAVREAVDRLGSLLVGMPEAGALGTMPRPRRIVEAAARSAVDLALRDLDAQSRGIPLVEALGGARRPAVPIYANITAGRSTARRRGSRRAPAMR